MRRRGLRRSCTTLVPWFRHSSRCWLACWALRPLSEMNCEAVVLFLKIYVIRLGLQDISKLFPPNIDVNQILVGRFF
jgi:hypothetical protein